jgi:DNA polymerase III subunit alpha
MLPYLHTHSHFSLLEALPSPAELVEAARALGVPALALTDHRLLSGAVEFHNACQKAGIQPILGLEIDLVWENFTSQLILLATEEEGWRNLCRISSALMLRPNPEAACEQDLFAPFAQGLIALSAGQGDISGNRLRVLAQIFPSNFYVLLENIDGEQGEEVQNLAKLADSLKLPCVAAHPIYYLHPEQAVLQRTLAAIRLNQPRTKLDSSATAPSGSWMVSPNEITRRFIDYPAALESAHEIADRCKFQLNLGTLHFPDIPLPQGMTSNKVLRQRAEEGAARLYGSITPEIRQRLDHELEVIAAHRFESVFLIVEEILDFARENGVPYSSRGSAASSLVAHCLGITSPDPLRLDLYFERFLNPARTSPPDIDTDLCSRRRDRVIQHVFETYGEEKVAMVGTINRFRPRSAFSDTAKAFALPSKTIRELSNSLPYAFFSRTGAEEDEGNPPSPFADLEQAHPQYREIFRQAEALLKLPRHLSVHAGGLVVAPGAVTNFSPVMRSGSKGVIITQMDLESVESLGLVKIDLLGIRGLTVMGDVAEAVHSWRRSETRGMLEVLDSIPWEDTETSDRIERGNTIGCFQIESPGMRATLREIRARTPDDVMVALALYRPGPISGGLKDAFVRRFKGEEPVEHLHPALEPLLQDTYGVILYQEQVLRIAHALAGLSLAEADLLRRAMSHFDPGKQMQLLREKFIARAGEINSIPADTAERVWELMAAFAGYGFPKAHAASYAQVSWRSAWCKTHFPAEFMAAVLANWGGYYSQRVYLSEARRMGLHILPPHINHSQPNFSVTYAQDAPDLYMGLDQVRELTHRTQERILRLRPFDSLEDFLTRVDPRRQEAINLVMAGALEGLGHIPYLLERIQTGGWRSGQMALFSEEIPNGEDWTLREKVNAQEEVLGISLEAHPLELYAAQIAEAQAISTIEAVGRLGQSVTVVGMRQSSHRSRTANGENMLFLTLEDVEGMLDVVLFPDVYRRARSEITGNTPLLITGKMEMDTTRGEPLLHAERVERISAI